MATVIVATVLLSLNSTMLPVTLSSAPSSSWSLVTNPATMNDTSPLLAAVNAQLKNNITDGTTAYAVFWANGSSSLSLIAQTCDATLTYIDPAAPDTCRLCSACSPVSYQVQPCAEYADTVCAARCPAGSYGHSGGVQQPGAIGSCSPCRAGTYAAYEGATACTSCTSNMYASSSGSTACLPCAQGMLSGSGATGCILAVSGPRGRERERACFAER